MSNPPALQTHDLCKNFGALDVANHIDFTLVHGARHALIGPNGAGKTTFINLVTGALAPTSGKVVVSGGDVTRLSEADRVKRGLVRTFQITSLFRELTVLENVCMAASERHQVGSRLLAPWQSYKDVLDSSWHVLKSLGLDAQATCRVNDLPYGHQRLLEIAVALVLKPNVLLLDEPAAGVPSTETGIIIDVIERLPDDISVLVIDHDMDLIFRVASTITVLAQGAILRSGAPGEIAEDPGVREIYLGKSAMRKAN